MKVRLIALASDQGVATKPAAKEHCAKTKLGEKKT